MNTFADLAATLERTHPNLLDRWEATAVVESMGFSDRRVAESFDLPSTAGLGAALFRAQRLQPLAAVPPNRTDDGSFVSAATSSLIYAVPWLLVFVAESWKPDILHLSAALSAPLSLALMASLVVSGGFVQAIARRGKFCVATGQIGAARSSCLYLMFAGLTTAGIVAAAGVVAGWYFSLFSARFLLLAASYFIVATALWMYCAILGLRPQSWRIPFVFVVGGGAFAAARAAGADVLIAQVAAVTTALACAAIQSRRVFAIDGTTAADYVTRVNRWIVAHQLAPYFIYGILYFTFLIADRVVVAAAVASRGSAFGVPQAYKNGMDLALLTLLLAAAVVECCNLALMRKWRAAAHLSYGKDFQSALGRMKALRYKVTAVMIAAFAGVALLVRAIAEPLTGRAMNGVADAILIVGDIGYLLFAIGLLNALAMISFNRVRTAVRALAAAVAVNLVSGTILGHVLGAYYVASGLTAGGVVFALLTSYELSRTLETPDTACTVA